MNKEQARDQAEVDACVQRLLAVALDGTPAERYGGANWYRLYGAEIARRGARHGLSAHQAWAIFATLSPQRSVAANYDLFIHFLVHPRRVPILTRQRAACVALRDARGDYATMRRLVSGPKVGPFYLNFCGHEDEVTIDRHAFSAAYGDAFTGSLTERRRRIATTAYRVVAAVLGVTPAAAQGWIWVVWRRQHGRTDGDLHTVFNRVDARYGMGA
jgi:hypothetical protein